MKTFDEWVKEYGIYFRTAREMAEVAWDYQQVGIDYLLFEIYCLRCELAKLKQ